MTGKGHKAKRKRAKEKKQQMEQRNRDMKPKKIIGVEPSRPAEQEKTLTDSIVEAALADQSGPRELGNNAEPPPPNVNEDAQKDEAMLATVPDITDQIVDAENKLAIPEPKKPFDPMSVVNNILKKQDEA